MQRFDRCLFIVLVYIVFSVTFLKYSFAEQFYKEGSPVISQSTKKEDNSTNFGPPFADLVKELSPAVVNISVEGNNEEEEQQSILPGLPLPKNNKPMQSLGSGFIVNEEGYIVTNNHVIDKSEKIIVRLLDDKSEYVAKLIGKDPKTDLALIKIQPKAKVKAVFLGDSDLLEVGEWVLAIGNQFQLGQTVTAGIVSAKSRHVSTRTGGAYDAFIQTDASINPGSSGGPLFNTKGQVIGINTAIFSPGRAGGANTGFNIGIGFSIPVNLAKNIITQLKEQGSVTRGLLGVIIQKVDTDVAEALNLPSPDGALVSDVMPDSPASKAGFKRSDVIIGYDGSAIRDHDNLPLMVANTPIGTSVKIDVLRSGQKETLTAVIEELKEKASDKEVNKPKPNAIGLVLEPVTDDIAKVLKMTKASGALVVSVAPNSIAEKAGVVRGDVIEDFSGQPVKDVEHLNSLVAKMSKNKPFLILVRRPEGTRYLTMKFDS
jgi:serine protease Do